MSQLRVGCRPEPGLELTPCLGNKRVLVEPIWTHRWSKEDSNRRFLPMGRSLRPNGAAAEAPRAVSRTSSSSGGPRVRFDFHQTLCAPGIPGAGRPRRRRKSGSHRTPRWRRQSRANSSQPNSLLYRENTGNFIDFGLRQDTGGLSRNYVMEEHSASGTEAGHTSLKLDFHPPDA